MSKLAIGGGLATAASVAVGVGLQGTHVSHSVALAFYALAGCLFLASIAAFLSNRNSTAPEASSQMQTSQGAGATNIQISHSEVDLSGVTSPARTAPVSHSIDELHASFSYDDGLLVVGIGNANPTIPDATLNLLVPDSLGSITSVDRETRSRHPGSQLHTPEPIGAVSSWIYWAVSGLRLRQRISHLMFFELGDARPGTYPVVLRLVADELPDRAEVQGSFTIPDPQIEAEVDERTEHSRGTLPVWEAHRDAVRAELNSTEIRRVLNEQIAELQHQRETIWEWSELRRHGSGLNDGLNWDRSKAVLHSYRQYADAFQATEVAWGAIGRLDVPQEQQTNYHRENAIGKIDAALYHLRKALDATP